MTGNVVISEVDASIYVVLSKTKTHVFISQSTKHYTRGVEETVVFTTEVGCRLYVYACVCVCVCVYIYTHTHIYVCICICVCVRVCEMTI